MEAFKPARFLNHVHTDTHRIRRLVTCHTGATISADRFKDRVSSGFDSTGGRMVNRPYAFS
jgi:hypothetical protein